jgi:SOS-response transcriptional repressor LexA
MPFGHNVRMEEPKDRLAKARLGAGYANPTEAANAIRSINKNTLISHENGNRAISRKAAENYARLFDVQAGWLLYGENAPAAIGEYEIPVVSMVSAGQLKRQDAVTPAEVEKWIRLSDLPAGDWIALTVDGTSMDRIAPEGSTLIVNRSDDLLIDGKFYIFALGGGEATFKTYRRSPERLQPFSTNPDHMSIPVTDDTDLYVFGRVRRVIQEV